MLATTFEGYGLGNVNFNNGPDGRWEFDAAADRPYSYARATWAPQGLKGFYTWNYAGEGATEDTTYNAVTNLNGISAQVTAAALTTNVATVTTATAHGFAVGQSVTLTGVEGALSVTKKAVTSNVATLTLSSVTANQMAIGDVITVAGVDETFNGTSRTLTGVNTTAGTVTFALVTADVTEANATGTIVRNFFNTTGTIDTVPSTTTFTFNDRAGTAMARTGGNITTITSPAGAVASTDSLSSSTTGYNVPGNVNFNPDEAIDRVIQSNES
jgi:hypothetical protein